MTTYTPISIGRTATLAAASAALTRLEQLSISLDSELKALPQPDNALLAAITSGDTLELEASVNALLQQLDDFWATRHDALATRLEQALRDEMTLKIHEGELDAQYAACLPPAADIAADGPVSAFSLHVQGHEEQTLEIAGALVLCHGLGATLLSLPGTGLLGFRSRSAMSVTLAAWLNDRPLQGILLNNAGQPYQDAVNAINNDPDLFLPAFQAADVQLQAISTNPFDYLLERQRHKQRGDVRHACATAASGAAEHCAALINRAMQMHGLLGPLPILELRELAYIESRQRRQLPQWFKNASSVDQQACQQRLHDYDQARSALLGALEGAASAQQFADLRLRARLANDLGYDLDPQALIVSTERSLPLTEENYSVSQSLLQLALYGLHPQDHRNDSAFLTRTTLSLNDAPVATDYPLLTPAYIARLVDELNLRVSFADFQRTTYGLENKQQLVRELTARQIATLAFTARLQNHIQPGELALVEAICGDTADKSLRVQQIKLHGLTLSSMLVLRKDDARGYPDRLVLFSADNPTGRAFQGFANETQLLHELVGWSASPLLSDYLLRQVRTADRAALQAQLSALNLKPQPAADFMQLIGLNTFQQGLRALVAQQLRVALAEQASHTPAWFTQASAGQRQELLALETAASAADDNYRSKAHTQVQEFEAYVHQRATQKINQLLGLADGQVDPDLIIIRSERETLTYTQMLRNGYDNSLGLINASADTMATFSGPDGVDLSPLTAEKVAGSVRGQWLADRYIAQLRATLLAPQSTGYDYRRKTSLLINQLQMQAAALRSLLKGHIDAAQYQWLRASLDKLHLNDAQTREDYPLFPLQLHIDKPFIGSGLEGVDQLVVASTTLIHIETVQGCFIVLPTQVRLAALLYTPQAPDGVEFRLFSGFVDSLQQPGMIDYYKDRCRLTARRTLAFFLRDMKQGGANKPPFIPKEWLTDLHEICFNRPLERKIRDVEDTTTGRNDMLAALAWTSIELIATAVTLPFPPASFAVGALLAFHDSMRAVKALASGTPEAASAFIIASVFNSAGALGDLHSGIKGFGSLLHPIKPNHARTTALRAVKPPVFAGRRIDLYPVILAEEHFWLGKPGRAGYAPLYRTLPDGTQSLQATGRFARRDSAGVWHPLGQQSAAPAPVSIAPDKVKPLESGHAKGVSIVNNKPCIELNGQVYEVQFDARLRTWSIIDPANPYAFFGKKPVHLDAEGHWQLSATPGLHGGMESYSQLPAQALPAQVRPLWHLDDYQFNPEVRSLVMNALTGKTSSDPIVDEFFAGLYADIRNRFDNMRKKLYRDARDFFAEPPLPRRPNPPALEADMSFEELLPVVFRQSNGLVISEAPKSVASKRLLIENMVSLAEQDVKVLYIEHLFTDLHLQKLAKYRKLASSTRSGSHEIRQHLDSLNNGVLDNGSTQYDYYHLVKAAHRHGIEVRPFSSAVSYPHAGLTAAKPGHETAEQKISNFFGHTLISHDTHAHPNRRWVALLDQRLANTWKDVPGISELEGVISVRVHDVPSSAPTLISHDVDGTVVDGVTLKSDVRLEMANPQIKDAPSPSVTTSPPELPPKPASQLDRALHRQLTGKSATAIDNPYNGEHGFTWSEADGWQRVDPQLWASESTPTPIQLSLIDSAYELPAAHRDTLHRLANFERKGLDHDYLLPSEQGGTAQHEFFANRATLQKDAQRIVSRELPARPTLPAVQPGTRPADFLGGLYQHSDGVVIGEAHHSIASKKLLIDNLPALSQQNVKTLYLEQLLSDLHQADLDRFVDTGHMSKRLLHDLKVLDRSHQTDPAGIYTFEKLLIRARENGLEICAIDCAASYYLKGLPDAAPTARQQMMNYFAARKIDRHQGVMGSHKWIALVGNTHANTYKRIVPGIAELQGGIGVRVIDVKPGAGNTVSVDPGELISDQIGGASQFVKSDYRITLETLQEQAH